MDKALIGVLLPQTQAMRDMALVLALDAFRQASLGDGENVVEDYQAMLGMAKQAAEPPFLVCTQVGGWLNHIAFESLEELLASYPDLFNDRQLAELVQATEKVSLREQIRLDGERAGMKDLVQRVYTDDGDGDGRLTRKGLSLLHVHSALARDQHTSPSSALLRVIGPGVALTSGSRKRLELAIDNIMDEYEAKLDVPYHEWTEFPVISYETLMEKHAANDLAARTFLGMLLPSIDQVMVACERQEGQRAGVLLALAAWRFKIENDRFPNTAEELIPKFIESVPVDVLTGDPLKYRLTADGLPLIYSVGGDGDDDLGRPAIDPEGKPLEAHKHFHAEDSPPVADGDWVLWPSSINSETQEQAQLKSE